jgi:CheY-like chemotaxis protein
VNYTALSTKTGGNRSLAAGGGALSGALLQSIAAADRHVKGRLRGFIVRAPEHARTMMSNHWLPISARRYPKVQWSRDSMMRLSTLGSALERRVSLSEIERLDSSTIHEQWVGVVDDDASLRIALARVLRSNGMHVEIFASAEDYLDRAVPGRPACLVLDIHLGGMSGFQLQQQLLSDGVAPPIIFITAHDNIYTAHDHIFGAAGSRAAEYLRKPFDTNALVALIRPHLSAASQEPHVLPRAAGI